MNSVAQCSHCAKENSIQYNLKLYDVFFRMLVCAMVPFMKHSISFSFKNVNSMKEITSMRQACEFELCIKKIKLEI